MSDTSTDDPVQATPVAAPSGNPTLDDNATARLEGPTGGVVSVPGAGRRARLDPLDLLERYGIIGIWGITVIIFSVLSPSNFPTSTNFQTIFGTQAVLLIMTLGLLVPLTTGEFDLAIAYVMGFSAIVIGYLNVYHGWPILAAVGGTLIVGLIIGLINAFVVVRLGVPSLVATLGMGQLLYGLSYGVSNEQTIGGIAQGLINFATQSFIFGLPLVFFYGLIFCFVVWYVFDYTPLGRYLVFVGEGREVARLAGLRVDGLRAGSLVVSALVATIAGILQAGVVGAADPAGGVSYLLPAFAGAFLGQTAIRPGRFNPWGTFVAVYFLVTGITGLELLGYTGWVQDVFYGASLVIAVALGRIVARRRAATATT